MHPHFRKVEDEYLSLKGRFFAGHINAAKFKEALKALTFKHQSRYWNIGASSGAWYVYDGKAWAKANPPTAGHSARQPSPTYTRTLAPARSSTAAAAPTMQTKFTAQVRMRPEAKGGRSTRCVNRYSPYFQFGMEAVPGMIRFGHGIVKSGETTILKVALAQPVAVQEKTTFSVVEAGRIVGSGTVVKLGWGDVAEPRRAVGRSYAVPAIGEAHRLAAHQGPVTAVALSRDGRLALTSGADCKIRIWETASGKEVLRLDGAHRVERLRKDLPVTAVAVSPDGHHFASCGEDNLIRVRETATGREICRIDDMESRTSVGFLADGRRLSTVSLLGEISVWSIDARHKLFQCHPGWLKGDDLALSGISRSRDGNQMLACIAEAGVDLLRLYDLTSGSEIRHFATACCATGFHPDGRSFVAAVPADDPLSKGVRAQGISIDALHRFDIRSGRAVGRVEVSASLAGEARLAFTPDGRRILAAAVPAEGLGAEATQVQLWDANSGRTIGEFRGHSDRIVGFAVSADGRWLLTGSNDATARLWRIPD